MELLSHSPEDTEDIGARLAEQLEPGAVVAFTGDLGAGKTAFTRGLARGWVSPTGSPAPPSPSSTSTRASAR